MENQAKKLSNVIESNSVVHNTKRMHLHCK